MIYDYLILRLRPDFIRGEVVNVGAVVWERHGQAMLHFWAPVTKVRALDSTWTNETAAAWLQNIESIVQKTDNILDCQSVLNKIGVCQRNAVGMFVANSKKDLAAEISEIKTTYVSPYGFDQDEGKSSRTDLVAELRASFKKMNVLGESPEDLTRHLIVQDIPIPQNPELRADFVYKNGVYRVTQTLDYRTSMKRAQQKIKEACTKMVAAQLAKESWGAETVKIAVVNVPSEVAVIADPHLDMLLSHDFFIFHSNKKEDMVHYHTATFGNPNDRSLDPYRA
ncbi:DUF3037 domain-containing protein [Alcaligenes faecalis]|uniref:DUF3037 domain-containing protein n=1 Tax=Alcaligenes faecalis TaxID=511 RepID=UPI00208F14F7|nr:DUF3037 domain-containing protein [Alcaligenes faecalis]USP46996.1 DUF3037 domain-containing protein [Alcaligenes faecalis]